jgi:DNA-binding MarR family transcriptional regulator
MPGPQPSITDEELLREIRLLPDPVVTAKEITSRVELENATVNRRLDRLVDNGYLNEKKVGAAAVVYWLTTDGAEKAAEN